MIKGKTSNKCEVDFAAETIVLSLMVAKAGAELLNSYLQEPTSIILEGHAFVGSAFMLTLPRHKKAYIPQT